MEEVAQGRVWTGNNAASLGLVDAVGGLSRAVAIAKQKANIPQDKQVTSRYFFSLHHSFNYIVGRCKIFKMTDFD